MVTSLIILLGGALIIIAGTLFIIGFHETYIHTLDPPQTDKDDPDIPRDPRLPDRIEVALDQTFPYEPIESEDQQIILLPPNSPIVPGPSKPQQTGPEGPLPPGVPKPFGGEEPKPYEPIISEDQKIVCDGHKTVTISEDEGGYTVSGAIWSQRPSLQNTGPVLEYSNIDITFKDSKGRALQLQNISCTGFSSVCLIAEGNPFYVQRSQAWTLSNEQANTFIEQFNEHNVGYVFDEDIGNIDIVTNSILRQIEAQR